MSKSEDLRDISTQGEAFSSGFSITWINPSPIEAGEVIAPAKLSSEAARIFAVVDVWDALTSDRPYRAAWSEEKAREHIRSGAGTHFDLRVVEAFLPITLENIIAS